MRGATEGLDFPARSAWRCAGLAFVLLASCAIVTLLVFVRPWPRWPVLLAAAVGLALPFAILAGWTRLWSLRLPDHQASGAPVPPPLPEDTHGSPHMDVAVPLANGLGSAALFFVVAALDDGLSWDILRPWGIFSLTVFALVLAYAWGRLLRYGDPLTDPALAFSVRLLLAAACLVAAMTALAFAAYFFFGKDRADVPAGPVALTLAVWAGWYSVRWRPVAAPPAPSVPRFTPPETEVEKLRRRLLRRR